MHLFLKYSHQGLRKLRWNGEVTCEPEGRSRYLGPAGHQASEAMALYRSPVMFYNKKL